ncbi:MAG TPA: hypothetical protein VHG08_01460 [Longimicrobium sp.]|nr:hypothetical protein [Longimicrobium sp.]
MTARTLTFVALSIALTVQIAMVLIYGAITDWCFCSVTGSPSPPRPPVFVLRFLDLAAWPAASYSRGLAVQVLFVLNLDAWFIGSLALLHAMALATRVRVRLVRAPAGPHERRIRLAPRESVRGWQMLVLACLLAGGAMAAGALHRQRWLARAEQVFAATMSAAAAGRPLPPEVEFSMYELRGGEYWPADPPAPYQTLVDPALSGTHLLDRFVVPYAYGGMVRFESGERYEFSVYGRSLYDEKTRWSISVHPTLRSRRR